MMARRVSATSWGNPVTGAAVRPWVAAEHMASSVVAGLRLVVAAETIVAVGGAWVVDTSYVGDVATGVACRPHEADRAIAIKTSVVAQNRRSI